MLCLQIYTLQTPILRLLVTFLPQKYQLMKKPKGQWIRAKPITEILDYKNSITNNQTTLYKHTIHIADSFSSQQLPTNEKGQWVSEKPITEILDYMNSITSNHTTQFIWLTCVCVSRAQGWPLSQDQPHMTGTGWILPFYSKAEQQDQPSKAGTNTNKMLTSQDQPDK